MFIVWFVCWMISFWFSLETALTAEKSRSKYKFKIMCWFIALLVSTMLMVNTANK